MKLTAVVLTRDEEAFIAGCLDSLQTVTDDILVVDSFSSDHTPRIARDYGARVIQREWRGFAAARNAALALAGSSDWVFFVDADERIPPALATEIRDLLGSGLDNADGYLMPRKNVICGRVMRGGGWWPDYQLRLLRPGQCCYPEDRTVHETACCKGPTLALNTPLIHFNYRSWREFARKQFEYAELAAATAGPVRARAFLGAPARMFWRCFVTDRGYRDGPTGLVAASLLSLSETYRIWRIRRNRA